MWIENAYAQAAPSGGAIDPFVQFLPLVAIIAIFYFLFIRPQQRRARQHQEMLRNLRRGDTVVTAGGLVGRIVKVVDDSELELQIADNVRVRLVRAMISEVRAKGEPVKEST